MKTKRPHNGGLLITTKHADGSQTTVWIPRGSK